MSDFEESFGAKTLHVVAPSPRVFPQYLFFFLVFALKYLPQSRHLDMDMLGFSLTKCIRRNL